MPFYRTLVSTIVFLFVLISCSTTPTGRNQLALLSDSEVDSMGVSSYEEIKKQTLLTTSASVRAYAVCVSHAIIPFVSQAPNPSQWEVNVFAEDQANAFALPGSKIGVYEGLLKYAVNQDQLAAVIGHEIGHVIAHHARERLSTQMATDLTISVGSKLFGVEDPENSWAVKAAALGAQYGVALPFSRAHESEADVIGLELMAKAGFNPEESVKLWQNMAKGGSAGIEFLSTHPSNENRIKNLKAHMATANMYYAQAKSQGKRPNCKI